MSMSRQVRSIHCYSGISNDLAQRIIRQSGSLTGADRYSIAQIGQRKICNAIAAVGRADQAVQRDVLTDRQQLTLTQRVSFRREIERDRSDLADKRLAPVRRHISVWRSGRATVTRHNSLESNDVGKTNGGLIIVYRAAVTRRCGGIGKQNEYSESEERNRCRSNPACDWIM
jgi:hypothetical protein